MGKEIRMYPTAFKDGIYWYVSSQEGIYRDTWYVLGQILVTSHDGFPPISVAS